MFKGLWGKHGEAAEKCCLCAGLGWVFEIILRWQLAFWPVGPLNAIT